jgi:uncharacterized membrane protein
MKLNDYKLVFIAVGLIGVLLIATPAIAANIHLPGGQQFSELYLLGPNKMAENYPFNIEISQNYSVYIGVANQMGSPQNYVLYVKLLNQTDILPNNTAGTPSPIQPLYECRFSIANGQNWNSLLTFSVSSANVINNQSTIENLNISGLVFNAEKPSIWNSTASEVPYRLLFELWIFNPQSNSIQYNDRFVDLQLNYTQPT